MTHTSNTAVPVKCDGLIFDMDGTLWDAVDSYARIWDAAFERCGVRRAPVSRTELISLMGQHLDKIMDTLCQGLDIPDNLLQVVDTLEAEMMPQLGGRLYPHVPEVLRALHGRVPLYMVSNCGADGLDNFLTFTGLRPLFRDWLTHGGTGLPKERNISTLIERYNLKHPVYVGDTETDSRAAHAAGAAMVWCRYGFGRVDDAEAVIDSFQELPQVIDIKQ